MAVAIEPRTTERQGAATFKGNPLTLVGSEVRVGSSAPDFQVTAQDLQPVRFSSSAGKVRVISAVPSLDTPVCDAQTRRFNEEASKFSSAVEVWTISMDLPFAQKRWCGAAGVDRVNVFSDHKEAGFGLAFGALVKELRLLTRAVFVVDANGVVRHAEYVREITTHPNYDAALAVVRSLTK